MLRSWNEGFNDIDRSYLFQTYIEDDFLESVFLSFSLLFFGLKDLPFQRPTQQKHTIIANKMAMKRKNADNSFKLSTESHLVLMIKKKNLWENSIAFRFFD